MILALPIIAVSNLAIHSQEVQPSTTRIMKSVESHTLLFFRFRRGEEDRDTTVIPICFSWASPSKKYGDRSVGLSSGPLQPPY